MTWLGMMYVVIGGAFGALCRYIILQGVALVNHTDFPYGTAFVNILGSFVLGAWISHSAHTMPANGRELFLLVAVGMLGGFTTFSAFSLDVFLLVEKGAYMQAGAYIMGSVLLSVLALLGGMWCMKLYYS